MRDQAQIIKLELRRFLAEINSKRIEVAMSVIVVGVIMTGLIWRFGDGSASKIISYAPYYMLWVLFSGTFGNFITSIKTDLQYKTINVMSTLKTPYQWIIVRGVLVRTIYDILVVSVYFGVFWLVFSLGSDSAFVLLQTLFTFFISLPLVIGVSLFVGGVVLITRSADIALLLGNVFSILILYALYRIGYYELLFSGSESAGLTLLGVLALGAAIAGAGNIYFAHCMATNRQRGGFPN